MSWDRPRHEVTAGQRSCFRDSSWSPSPPPAHRGEYGGAPGGAINYKPEGFGGGFSARAGRGGAGGASRGGFGGFDGEGGEGGFADGADDEGGEGEGGLGPRLG